MENRVIMFRAWNGEQMISPDYIDRKGFAHWKEDSIPTSTDKVMQFTGLHDKNGKEVFEGDILSNDSETNTLVDFVNENSCGCCNYGSGYEWSKDEAKNLTVIGNIYENPELLQ